MGLFVCKNIIVCELYVVRICSWCDEGDIYCDLGLDWLVYGLYFVNYIFDVVEFIVERFNSFDIVVDVFIIIVFFIIILI